MTAPGDAPPASEAAAPGEQKEQPPVAAKTEVERRRLLIAGDVDGNLVKLFTQVESQQKKVGAFNVLFAVGAFLPGAGGENAAAAASALAEYATGKRSAPVETYFVESRSAAILQAAPEGKQLCERVHFLGGYGIRDIMGLRVAYLSGRYDAGVYAAHALLEGGPAFVGAAYTPQAIEGLVRLAKASPAPIDVLLTSEWPIGIDGKLEEPERPKDPDGGAINWQEVGATPIAELVSALEPRYHVFGTADIFYQRPPFQTQQRGHVCRCIGVGKVGSKGKGRLWVHGLALTPASSMPEAALMQRPANTTPCPFALARRGVKRDLPEGDGEVKQEGEGHVIPDQVFLSRLPPNIDEKRLQAALKHVGKIERIHFARDEAADGKPCKGFGWVTFSTPEEADAACDLTEMLECGGRKIAIELARPRKRSAGNAGKKREIQIVIQPHTDCWFCLVNPQVEKHMIVCVTTEVYVATARGPILPSHVLVLPVKHAPCFAACPPELQQSIQTAVDAVRKMFKEGGQECIVWERWIPMSISAANHMQIQIVPVDISSAGLARQALEESAKRYLPGVSMKRIMSHAEVAQHVNDDSAAPYIYFEIPGDNTAKGRAVERYMHASIDSDGPRIPLNFGRQVACHLLGCEEKADWRGCQDDRETEKELATVLRQQFKPFAPGKS